MRGEVILAFHGFHSTQVFWEPLNFQGKSSEGALGECESLSLLPRFPNSSSVDQLGFPVSFTFW